MAYKEKKMDKASIQALYNELGSMPNEKSKTAKNRKPGTVKRSGNKTASKKK